MFQLSQSERDNLQSQIATATDPTNLQSQIATAKRRTLPYVFTEQGVSMLSSILKSDQAIEISIQIMQAFVTMRKILLQNASVFQHIDKARLPEIQSGLDEFNAEAIELSNTISHNLSKLIQ